MDTFDNVYEKIAKGNPVPPQKELSVLVQASMIVLGKPAEQLAQEIGVTIDYAKAVIYDTCIPPRELLYKLCNALELPLGSVLKISVIQEQLALVRHSVN